MDRKLIMEALSQVNDPELHRSLTSLNMIQDVVIEGNDVTVTVALTTKGCPMKTTIVRSVEEKLQSLPGIGKVKVNLTEMTAKQKLSLFGSKPTSPIADPNGKTQVIAVASGKGGVGKSTVTVNLAAALKQLGLDIGILDCDIYGFSVPRMLGVENVKPNAVEGRIMPVPAYGMKVISMGNFVSDNSPVIWRGPMLGKVLQQFLTDVYWGEPDVLLLDLPPGTGDMALDVARMIPKSNLLVVTTPEKLAAGVASRAAQMADKTNQRILGVVENMSAFVCPCCGEQTAIFGTDGGKELAEQLNVPLLGQIPLTLEARSFGDQGRPIALADESVTAAAFRTLAQKVAEILRITIAAKQ
ncbi:MAG: Mrp/NBP35 family ATP-binding protein [Limnochordia bacterium]